LQVEIPNQLSGRQLIIRRADLGAAGIYYRALVNPFASAEKAAKLCSGLKAAGGDCIIQKTDVHLLERRTR
jgi:SPOR domain